MSEAEKNNFSEPEEKNTKDISKGKQWLFGIIAGIITSVSIYISGVDFGIADELIAKILQYLFLIVFVAVMIAIKQTEMKREISLRTLRTAYFVGMLPGLAVFVIMAITAGALSCA